MVDMVSIFECHYPWLSFLTRKSFETVSLYRPHYGIQATGSARRITAYFHGTNGCIDICIQHSCKARSLGGEPISSLYPA